MLNRKFDIFIYKTYGAVGSVVAEVLIHGTRKKTTWIVVKNDTFLKT